MDDKGAERQRELRKYLASSKNGKNLVELLTEDYERERDVRYRKAWVDLWAHGKNHGETTLD